MITQNEFIKRCIDIHGERYDYSKSIFKSYNDKIIVICKIHGEFNITVNNFLTYSRNCKKCGNIQISNTKLFKSEFNFINNVKKIYNDLYSFKHLKFNGLLKPVILTCKIHGDFEVIARNVLRGKGCLKCYSCNYNNFNFKDWKSICFNNKAYLYLINIYNTKESFYKIGITKYKDINKRYSNLKQSGYKFKLLLRIEDIPENIWTSEKLLIEHYKKYHYIPKSKFCGSSTECFKIINT